MSWGVTPASMGREHKAVLTERFSIIYSYVLIRTCFCSSFPQHWGVEVLRSKHFVLPEEKWNWPSPQSFLLQRCQDCSGAAVSFLGPLLVCLGVLWFFSYLISVLVCAMWYQEAAARLLWHGKAAGRKTPFIRGVEAVTD